MRTVLIVVSVLGLGRVAAANTRTCDRSFIALRGARDVTMAGDTRDLDRVRKAVAPGDRAVWTRTEACKEYLVRDAAIIDQIDREWQAANALSDQLTKLGEQQDKLGDKQGKLGEQEGTLGEREGQLAEQSANASDDEREAIQHEMEQLEAAMRVIEVQIHAFDKPMCALDRQMQALEAKEAAASNQAEEATYAVLAKAIAKGIARPFP